ncbi:Eco57I restriction-modification methylase domain-containing protein [Sporosalibacterium faouarense]|uniref:Eco57I restriction-modification methylase domain-containing protein n=1 Tax=Sporosalibacterium faouarense TaxID=516123 RepID=UPI00192C39A3|nr:N-6 DNA methylase [Sporosalibacterium faouarense]
MVNDMVNLKEKLNLIIDKIIEEFGKEYTEEFIFDSVIILKVKELKGDYKEFLGFSEEKINRTTQSPVFNFLSSIMDSEIIREDNLIPLIYELVVKRQEKKEKYSIYYTPDWLVEYIAENSLTKVINQNYTKGKGEELKDIKILEPACGAGMFLIHVFKILINWYKKYTNLKIEEIVKSIVENNLYGVDIDSKALELCKYNIYLKCLEKVGGHIDLNFNFKCIDFLMENELDINEYDFIIGNPPYLENRRINKHFNKDSLKERYMTATGRFDIYSLFIEKSIELTSCGGKIAFVLPGNLLTNNNFTPIRKLILENTYINEIVNLGEGIFESVSMNMAIIILEKKEVERKENLIVCKNIMKSKNIMKDIKYVKPKLIPQFYYEDLMKNVFDIHSSDITFELRKRIFEKSMFKLNDICEVIAGIATGNIRKKLLTTNGNIKNTKKILEGKNISDYCYSWKGLYIIDDKGIIDKTKGEYATFMRKEFIDDEKILIRQTADRFICAYDDEGYYLLNTLYSLKVRDEYKDKVNIKYILALLNSNFYSFLYRSLVRESGKVFPQVKIFHIQNNPIIIPEKNVQNDFAERVDRIIEMKKGLVNNTSLESKSWRDFKLDIVRNMQYINREIYKIFDLTDREINEIENEMSIY